MYDPDDTIAAIATPPGQSGIGVIRVSGSRSFALTDGVFHSASSIPLEKRRDGSIHIRLKMSLKYNATAAGNRYRRLWGFCCAAVSGLRRQVNSHNARS